jgi:1-acyl-sn-glycerol-3-phosphate acyltransferase
MTRLATQSSTQRPDEAELRCRPMPAVLRAWRMLRVGLWLLAFAAYAFALAPILTRGQGNRFLARWARATLHALGVRLAGGRLESRAPGPALLVANHVSSIDALLISALRPACFVAKSQLAAKAWLRRPLAAFGTIFIDRGRREGVLHALAQMYEAFDADQTVALFPEATVTGERDPQPFNSALLEPASDGVPTYLIALSLARADGTSCPEADFPLGQSFAAGYWRLSRVPEILARAVVLGPFDFSGVPRKRIARIARESIRRALSAAPVHRPAAAGVPMSALRAQE